MREILRTQSQESPHSSIHRFHGELMCKILVFVAQFSKVTLVKGIPLVLRRYSVQFQQSCLPHKYSLYLEDVVTMVVNSL